MTDIALRCYVDTPKKEYKPTNEYHSNSLVLVFDTETTIDEYQNLQFGSCGIWINGHQRRFVLFYNDTLKDNEINIITAYAEKHKYEVMPRGEFVEKIFFPYVYKARAICVGFDLPSTFQD